MWSALSNLFILPFLLVISTPLALSASITAFLAFTTLFLRALAAYCELIFALLVNFFLFPAHSPSSAPFLALSGATTPAAERSPSRVKHYYQGNAQHSSNTKSWHTKEVVGEDYFFHHHHTHLHGPTLLPSHEALSSFISGDAERDFEGVGGWRTPLSSRKKHRAPSASSVSYNSSEEQQELNEDDQAWVSINKRLELPSRHLNLVSANVSPVMATAATVELVDQPQEQRQRPRFHRRSVTTPLFSTPSPTAQSSFPVEQDIQLQSSKSSAHLPSSSIPSQALFWQDTPFLMTPTGVGTDYKMVHYPGFVSRRRRSSASSSAVVAKGISLTGLGLT